MQVIDQNRRGEMKYQTVSPADPLQKPKNGNCSNKVQAT